MATHLQEQYKLQPGDRVGLWLKNCPEFIFQLLFGILAAGGVVVPINNFLKPAWRFPSILADAGADILITDQTLVGFVPELQRERPELKSLLAERFSETTRYPAESKEDGAGRGEADLAVMVFTRRERRAGPRARCCRTAICCTMWRVAGWYCSA